MGNENDDDDDDDTVLTKDSLKHHLFIGGVDCYLVLRRNEQLINFIFTFNQNY